jgi:hypothetical protein
LIRFRIDPFCSSKKNGQNKKATQVEWLLM